MKIQNVRFPLEYRISHAKAGWNDLYLKMSVIVLAAALHLWSIHNITVGIDCGTIVVG